MGGADVFQIEQAKLMYQVQSVGRFRSENVKSKYLYYQIIKHSA